jgi:hypothetical protein
MSHSTYLKHLVVYESYQQTNSSKLDPELRSNYMKALEVGISFPEIYKVDRTLWVMIVEDLSLDAILDHGLGEFTKAEIREYLREYDQIRSTPQHKLNRIVAALTDLVPKMLYDNLDNKSIDWWIEHHKGLDRDLVYMMKSLWDDELLLPVDFIQVK